MTSISKLYPNTKYLVAYVADSISVMNEQKRTNIETMLSTIGEEVEGLAGIIIPPRGKENENIDRFKNEHDEFYSNNVRENIPCLIVVEDDFASFDWQSCRWAVVGLSSLFDENGQLSLTISESFTRDFIAAVRAEESIFDHLYEMKIDENRRKLLSTIELKPGLFGFSIDLKNFFSIEAPSASK